MLSITQLRRTLCVAVVVVAGSLGVAAPSHAQDTFKPTSVTVHDIEDWWWDGNDDEIELHYGGGMTPVTVVNGTTSFGPFHAVPFSEGMAVSAYEVDDGYPHYLGTRYVSRGGASLQWGGSGQAFHYQLNYAITSPPSGVPLTASADCGLRYERYGQFISCVGSASGGTGTHTYRWTVAGRTASNGQTLYHACGARGYKTVELRVTDQAGTTAYARERIYCETNH